MTAADAHWVDKVFVEAIDKLDDSVGADAFWRCGKAKVDDLNAGDAKVSQRFCLPFDFRMRGIGVCVIVLRVEGRNIQE
jgi:hypothetical protein